MLREIPPYVEFGCGFPLVLGSSYLWGSTMWQPQIEALATRYRLIVPLLPGHHSDARLSDAIHQPSDLAEGVSALLESLGIDRYAVAGASVGGMWATELALRHPLRVRGLLLLDTYLGAEPEAHRLRYYSMLDTIENAGCFPPALIDQIVPIFFRPDMPSTDPLRTAFAETLENWPRQQVADVVALGRLIFGRPDDMWKLSALNPARTLVAVGENDTPRPPAESARMAAIIGCPLRVLPGAGHIPSREAPDAVTTMMEQWLAHVTASGGDDGPPGG